jgi:hypothetical protein
MSKSAPSSRHEERRLSSGAKSAYSIPEFCQAHSISRSLYYKLKKLGQAPRELEVLNRKLITEEAAARWRAEREVAA